MLNEINSITQHFFQKDNLNEVTEADLENFLSRYPYASSARFLLARKKLEAQPEILHDDLITAGLYFNNPLWLQWQLTFSDIPENNIAHNGRENGEMIQENHEPVTETVKHAPSGHDTADDTSPIVFQSYHTIDYFASQGIRLQQAELSKDKLGQQLKSFTEWLRSMKKLPATESTIQTAPEDVSRQQVVIQSAASSIEEKEVVTEAMAEVWAKQGNTAKAIEIYDKLSLQNPGKSAYFAAKIDQLKY